MSSTKICKLSEVITIQNGYAFASKKFTTEEGMPLIRIRDLKNGNTTQTKYSGNYDEAYLVKSGDLLIGMDGEFKCYEWKGSPALLNQRVCRIQNINETFDLKYLYYGINSYLKAIEDVTGYTTVKHLSSSTILNIEFPIPSLEKQREIVEKLDKAFVEIDLLEKNLDQNSEYILEIEASLVANLWVKYADKLTVKRLEEVADYKNGSAHEKIVDESGDFVIVNSKFISSNGLKFKRSSKQLAPLKIGDVTMVLSDVPNGKALAKCFLVDKDGTYTLNQRICKLTSEDLLPEFLALNVNRNPYLLSFNNGENQTNLRLNDVLKTPIYVADKETQKLITDEFVEAKKTILGYSKLNMRKAESLKILKQSLLISNFSNLESDAA